VNSVFADTFYWIALINPRDENHRRALEFSDSLVSTLIVTTDEVLTEFLDFCAFDPQLKAQGILAVQVLLTDPQVRVIGQSRASFLAGLDLYQSRPDKGYSLTDCISMQTMRRQSISTALTGDRHFQQEGFLAVFREP